MWQAVAEGGQEAASAAGGGQSEPGEGPQPIGSGGGGVSGGQRAAHKRAQEMATALNALGWRKVLVCFPGLPNAHHKITAHRGGPVTAWLAKAGESVVGHQAMLLLS